MKIGVLPLGRPTFDVEFAEQKHSQMLEMLAQSGHQIVGPQTLLLYEADTRTAIEDLSKTGIDGLLILQVTFTDASTTVAAAAAFDQPLSIWAVPEPRLGGRLRRRREPTVSTTECFLRPKWLRLRLQAHGRRRAAPRLGAHRRKRPRRALPGLMLHQDGSSQRVCPPFENEDLIVTMERCCPAISTRAFFVAEEGTMTRPVTRWA